MKKKLLIILPALFLVSLFLTVSLVIGFSALKNDNGSLNVETQTDKEEEDEGLKEDNANEEIREEERDDEDEVEVRPEDGEEETEHLSPIRMQTPERVRSLYMTSCYAGSPSLRSGLVQLIETTELNSIVIDIKDFTGMISFRSNDPELEKAYATHCPVGDMKEFVHELNERGIYVIGRISVFQDNFLTKKRPDLAVLRESDRVIWRDNKGISFTDPSSVEVWDYHIKLTKESYELGFDEINFDYIRFPSDGPMGDIYFPHSKERERADVIEEFFHYLHQELKDVGVVTSADLFGMTTSVYSDLGIGQIWEKALPYFDFISPMVYPSHYPVGFKGLGNPNEYPYQIVKWSLDDAIERTTAATTTIKTIEGERVGTTTPAIYTKDVFDKNKIRPWIQDFRYGGPYTAEDVRLQIQAVYSAGLDSWMLWDPSNRYTPGALKPAP